jgi:hypothetical protein
MMGGTNDNSIKAENLMIVLAGVMNLQVDELLTTSIIKDNNKH